MGTVSKAAVLLLLLTNTTQGIHQHSHSDAISRGIFDRMEMKLGEKERLAQEQEVQHQKNLVKAQKQALELAGLDEYGNPPSSNGSMDDDLDKLTEKVTAIPIKTLAGVPDKKDKNERKQQSLQSLVQQKAATKIAVAADKQLQQAADEEEERDDFEGFGSITEMLKHKDVLVERKLNDASFKAEIATEEKKKKDEEAKEKQALIAKEKSKALSKELAKKLAIRSAKAKLEAALNKAKVKPAAPVAAAPAPPVLAEEPVVEVPEPVQPIVSLGQNEVSTSVYHKALSSILDKKKKPEKKKLPALSSLSGASDNTSDEPMGFIGQYSKKLTKIQEVQNQEQDQLLDQYKQPLGDTAYSKDAPRHKGMLARAMEKDLKEQALAEEKEKDNLMKEAMADPLFKMQLDSLQAKQAMGV